MAFVFLCTSVAYIGLPCWRYVSLYANQIQKLSSYTIVCKYLTLFSGMYPMRYICWHSFIHGWGLLREDDNPFGHDCIYSCTHGPRTSGGLWMCSFNKRTWIPSNQLFWARGGWHTTKCIPPLKCARQEHFVLISACTALAFIRVGDLYTIFPTQTARFIWKPPWRLE